MIRKLELSTAIIPHNNKGYHLMPQLALFLHIQKTAGTSVIHIFQKFYENSFISHNSYSMYKPQELFQTGFISGHFGYDYAKKFLENRYCFTFLRDPIDRVLSFYYFCLRSNPDEFEVYKLAQQNTIENFLEMGLDHPQVRPFIWNHQTWQIACGWGNSSNRNIFSCDENHIVRQAISHLPEFNHIGFRETFNKDISIILKGIGIKHVTRIPTVNASQNRPKVEDLPSTIIKRLEHITELDQKLYDFAWSDRKSTDFNKMRKPV